MGYRIEYRQPLGLPFYAEFCFVTRGAREPVRSGATKHVFTLGPAFPFGCSDYGWSPGAAAFLTGTQDNGIVQTFEPGLVVVTIPAAQLPRFCDRLGSITHPFRLIANKADGLSSVLAQGTITFGDR